MSDETHDDASDGRVTAPQQDYTWGQVFLGFVIMMIGLFIVGALPFVPSFF